MKYIKSIFTILSISVIVACSTSKKTTTTVSTTPTAAAPLIFVKPNYKATVPSNDALTAIQIKFQSTTIQTLNDGYKIYTGKCTNCHEEKEIKMIEETNWKGILDDMAQKAYLSDTEKDAVNKYVLSIKAIENK